MQVQDYLIDHTGFDWPTLLANWTWLLPESFTVWLMNRFGDLFLIFSDGTVHMLDIGRGELEKLADNKEDFCNKIDEGNNANQWLMIPLVDNLVAAGVRPGEGQCHSYRKLPILGGDYTVQNTVLLPIREHFGCWGSVHEQLQDVPDGTEVSIKVVNAPGRKPEA